MIPETNLTPVLPAEVSVSYPHMRKRFEDGLLPFEDALMECLGFGVSDLHSFLTRTEVAVVERIEEQRRKLTHPLSDALRATKFRSFGKDVLEASIQELLENDAKKFAELKQAFDGFGMASLFLIHPASEVEDRILETISCRMGENREFLERIPKFRG